MSNIAAVPVVNKKGEATVQVAKVQRYWKGKAPAYVDPNQVEEEDDEEESEEDSSQDEALSSKKRITFGTKADDVKEAVPFTRIDVPIEQIQLDRRLQRLQASSTATTGRRYTKAEDSKAAVPSARPRRKIDESASEEEENDESQEDEARRPSVAFRPAHVSPDVENGPEIDEEEEEEEEEEETSSEEESAPAPRLKPVFVPRNKRQVAEDASDRIEIVGTTLKDEKNLELRRSESKKLVESEIKRELVESIDEQLVMVDDTDGVDPDVEYESWKTRELARLKRDLEARIAWEKEQEEVERRRNMTPEERAKEEERIRREREESKQNRPKMKFLQKYYHKGAFYGDDDILKRSYHEATGDDQFNREVLPEILQRRNFGKSGQTKWTHLVNEDTSRHDDPRLSQRHIAQALDKKRGGMGDIDLPRKRRL